MKLANATRTSRVMVNQPQSASNSGNLWNGMCQTFSLGCGSWGGNGTNNTLQGTLIGTEKTGRRCYGIELEPGFVVLTILRWQPAFDCRPDRIAHR